MKSTVLTLLFLGLASAASAQNGGGSSAGGSHWFDAPAEGVPAVAIRPFLDVSSEKFLAEQTFTTIFGETSAPFWGGGVQVVVWQGRIYGEVAASRLLKPHGELVGERVFLSGGNVYRLGIPLRATIKPFEIVGGYRFNLTPRVIPFVGAGFTQYHYTETSDFAQASENFDATNGGGVFEAGAELRVHRWVGVAADAHYARVSGILGTGGVSQRFATGIGGAAPMVHERELGGWAVRLKVVVGP